MTAGRLFSRFRFEDRTRESVGRAIKLHGITLLAFPTLMRSVQGEARNVEYGLQTIAKQQEHVKIKDHKNTSIIGWEAYQGWGQIVFKLPNKMAQKEGWEEAVSSAERRLSLSW